MTTELPTKLTVRYILANAYGKKEGSKGGGEGEPEDPKKILADNGCEVTSEDTEEDIKAAAVAILSATSATTAFAFWQKHAFLHPQKGRVKNWLWIHDRYRNQADAMLALTDDPTAQKAAFQKFHKKIESHSEFEDTQLFKYFVDSKIGNQTNLEELMRQHKDIRLVNEITEGLDQLCNEGDDKTNKSATQEKLAKYVEDLKSHLDLEEKTIVCPWLQLTPEEYKKYRSYLSWTYCFMY